MRKRDAKNAKYIQGIARCLSDNDGDEGYRLCRREKAMMLYIYGPATQQIQDQDPALFIHALNDNAFGAKLLVEDENNPYR